MRPLLIVLSACALMTFLSACDNGDEGKDIPRTVPPSLGTVAAPDVTPVRPRDKKKIEGVGPVYET